MTRSLSHTKRRPRRNRSSASLRELVQENHELKLRCEHYENQIGIQSKELKFKTDKICELKSKIYTYEISNKRNSIFR